jgi:hypothetical protein
MLLSERGSKAICELLVKSDLPIKVTKQTRAYCFRRLITQSLEFLPLGKRSLANAES